MRRDPDAPLQMPRPGARATAALRAEARRQLQISGVLALLIFGATTAVIAARPAEAPRGAAAQVEASAHAAG